MEHLNHDELTLLHYGESVRPDAREHLLRCETCRQESEVLRRVLDAVDDSAETPQLAPSWEEHLWNRLRWKLERRRSQKFVWASAAAAMLVIAFLAGRAIERFTRHTAIAPIAQKAAPPAPNNAAASTAEGRERVLLVVLEEHFDRSERMLTEVKNASSAAPVIADRAAIEDLMRKNRLYLEAANSSGQTSLAKVLEEMQPLLLELARAPENPSPRDIEMLQKRIEKRGAVLKCRVAGEQIRKQQSL